MTFYVQIQSPQIYGYNSIFSAFSQSSISAKNPVYINGSNRISLINENINEMNLISTNDDPCNHSDINLISEKAIINYTNRNYPSCSMPSWISGFVITSSIPSQYFSVSQGTLRYSNYDQFPITNQIVPCTKTYGPFNNILDQYTPYPATSIYIDSVSGALIQRPGLAEIYLVDTTNGSYFLFIGLILKVSGYIAAISNLVFPSLYRGMESALLWFSEEFSPLIIQGLEFVQRADLQFEITSGVAFKPGAINKLGSQSSIFPITGFVATQIYRIWRDALLNVHQDPIGNNLILNEVNIDANSALTTHNGYTCLTLFYEPVTNSVGYQVGQTNYVSIDLTYLYGRNYIRFPNIEAVILLGWLYVRFNNTDTLSSATCIWQKNNTKLPYRLS